MTAVRQPAGIPTGGQFAKGTQARPAIELDQEPKQCHCGAPVQGPPSDYPDVCSQWPLCEQPVAAVEPVRTRPRRREPVEMDRYFASCHHTAHDNPWRRDGIHIALDPQTWASMPVEQLDPRGMHATQRRVFHKHLDRHRAGGSSAEDADGGDLPWVVEYRGERYLLDGHHRTVTAIDEDQPTMPAHIMRIAAR